MKPINKPQVPENKSGRPRKQADEKKVRFTITVSPEVMLEIQEKAIRYGVSVSSIFERAARRDMKNDL